MSNRPSERRREPRVYLSVAFTVEGRDEAGNPFSIDTKSVDLSPSGAAILMEKALAIGSIVTLRAKTYPFAARAVIRSHRVHQAAGAPVVGVEYLDGVKNPVVSFPG